MGKNEIKTNWMNKNGKNSKNTKQKYSKTPTNYILSSTSSAYWPQLFAYPQRCYVLGSGAVAREEGIFEILNGHIRHGND